MEQLTLLFSNLGIHDNYEQLNRSVEPLAPHVSHDPGLEYHKKTILHSMSKFFYTSEIEQVLSSQRSDPTNLELVYTDFYEGNVPKHEIQKDDTYYQALNYVYDKFKPPMQYRPVHLSDIQYNYPFEWSSNAEAPFATEPFFRDQAPRTPGTNIYSFGNMKTIVFNHTRLFLHQIKDGAPFDDYLWHIQLHNRTSVTKIGEPEKIRSISGFPRPPNIGWIMFLWPYIAYLKQMDSTKSPMLWKFETNLGGWLRLNYLLMQNYLSCSFIMLDKTKFDKYYYFQIQDDIDEMIYSFINFDNGYLPTRVYPDERNWSATKANRLRRLYRYLCYSFRNTPIATPDGHLYRRKYANMPSGVYNVQLYDTIYFAITDTCTLLHMGFNTDQILLRKGQGDDIITKLGVVIPPNEHQAFLAQYSAIDHALFGSTVKPEKSDIRSTPQGCKVLGYANNNGFPERDSIELLANLYHTKARRISESITMSIAVGIAYASFYRDPRVYNACKDTFDYYAQQGFTLSENWLTRHYAYTGLDFTNISLDTFPTPEAILSPLFSFDFKQSSNNEKFFPMTHFSAMF
jgi:hypothetical protein